MSTVRLSVLFVLVTLASSGCGRTLSPTAPNARGPAVAAIQPEPEAPSNTDDFPGAPTLAPPTVTITSPRPSPLLVAYVPPSFTIQWEGADPDGPGPGIKSYRYLLMREDDPDGFQWAIVEPDSVRRRYAPRFEGWTEVSGKLDSVELSGLTPGERYLFVITAFDRRGDHDPVFSLSKNMLRFEVIFSGAAASEETADGSQASRARRGS